MKVELVQGCTCDAYDVDGKSVVNFSTQELKELLKKQFESVLKHDNRIALYELSYKIAEDFSDHLDTSEPCECCGESVWTYTMNL
jgi:hypothetical protein